MPNPSTENNPPADDKKEPWTEPTQQATPLASVRPLTSVWRRYLLLVGLGLAILFIAGWGVLQLTHAVSDPNRYADTGSQSGSDQSDTDEAIDSQSGVVVEQQALPNVISTREAAQRSAVLQAQADVQVAQDLLTRLLQQQQRWQELVPPLLEDEAGRRIAAEPGAVKLFAAAQDRERITPRETEGLRRGLLALAAPVEAAAADENAVLELDSVFMKRLNTMVEQLKPGLRQWQEDNALVRLLVSEAEQRPPAETTLAETLERLRAADLRQQAEQIAADVESARVALAAEEAESQMRLQELESRKRLAANEVEAKRREAELANLNAEQLALADQLVAQRAKAELERKYQSDLAVIRSVLVPFITPGNMQMVDGRWKQIEEKQPLSWKGIQGFGILSGEGMSDQSMFHVGGGSKNDRPNGQFGSYIGGALSQSQAALVLKAQRLLRTYGELMVEKGLLVP